MRTTFHASDKPGWLSSASGSRSLPGTSNPLEEGFERTVDPLAQLGFPENARHRQIVQPTRDGLVEYEHSHIGPMIPGRLHPKQLEVLHDRSRHRWLIGGNQSGKTTLGAVDCALLAVGRHPLQRWEPPVSIWASGLSWSEWETVLLPELLTWLPHGRIIDAPEPHAKGTKRQILVEADNGTVSRIVGKSAEQGRAMYQGRRIHAVWLDEEHPLAIWQELQPRLSRFGGVTLGTLTPLMGLTWIHDDHYEPWKRGAKPDTFCLHAGLADNPSISPEEVERTKREFEGDPAQLAARLYGLFTRPTGLAIGYDPGKHRQTWTGPAIEHALRVREWTQYCGIDFGHWRFAFVHLAADHAKRSHLLGEYFSQCESLETRARWIHEYLTRHHAAPAVRIWGDAANRTDIFEMNRELGRLGSPYRVRPVAQGSKVRRPSVTKINNLLARGALLIRRGIGEYSRWRLRMSAASDGKPVLGSRFLWELNHWRYPAPRDGGEQRQRQDPDDNTADGADMIAALRYAVMSHYRPPKVRRRDKRPDPNRDTGLEEFDRRLARERWRAR